METNNELERRNNADRRTDDAINNRDGCLKRCTYYFILFCKISVIGLIICGSYTIFLNIWPFGLWIIPPSLLSMAPYLMMFSKLGIIFFPITGLISGFLLHSKRKQNEEDFLDSEDDEYLKNKAAEYRMAVNDRRSETTKK